MEDAQKQALINKRSLLLRKKELLSQRASIAETTAPVVEASNQEKPMIGNPVSSPGFYAGNAVGGVYNQAKEAISNKVASYVPQGPKTPITMPNPLLPIQSFQVGETDSKDSAKQLTGMALDEIATVGLVKAPKAIKFLSKGADKGITALLRRIGGTSSGDIKSGRSLMEKYGVGYVMSKLKAKPEYLGREIAPKATEVAHSAVNSMQPSAMREIGISEDSTKIAQDIKGEFGLNEFPTTSKADKIYKNVIDSAPDDLEILPKNLDAVLSETGGSLSHSAQKEIKRIVSDRARSAEDPYRLGTGLSKKEYNYIRGIINDEIQAGNNVGAQAIKEALDTDAEAVIPGLKKAKGIFQVSRNTEKAEGYLDKMSLGKEMESKLRSAEAPKNVALKGSLKRLLGDKAGPLLDDLEAQRLARGYYDDSARSSDTSLQVGIGNMVQRKLLRPLPRTYEKLRAGAINMVKGLKKPAQVVEAVAENAPQAPKTLSQMAKERKTAYAGSASSYQGPEIIDPQTHVPYKQPYAGGTSPRPAGKSPSYDPYFNTKPPKPEMASMDIENLPDAPNKKNPFDDLGYEGSAGNVSEPDVFPDSKPTKPGYGDYPNKPLKDMARRSKKTPDELELDAMDASDREKAVFKEASDRELRDKIGKFRVYDDGHLKEEIEGISSVFKTKNRNAETLDEVADRLGVSESEILETLQRYTRKRKKM